MTREKALYLRSIIEAATLNLTDDVADTAPELFPPWKIGLQYNIGDRVRDKADEKLYKCVQAHTSQIGWNPMITPALWARTNNPVEEWPEWIQPTGAQDAYMNGDKVSHNNQHWISGYDNNVWEPGVFGWTNQ